MAVNPTGAIYKSLFFDGEDSKNYGVYITGQAVFNAPEREVEMVSIPGRNGQFALDKGRFENIEVTYPAGIFADNEADFAEAISNFRNLLCSRRGYVRLQDEYNPNEYRMAIYKSGLEVEPALLRAGEFNIVFDCKPQRWLTSGETANKVDSGDVVSNPTLFESSPVLEVEGYGELGFNGYELKLTDGPLGDVVARGAVEVNYKPRYYRDEFEITALVANSGDSGVVNTSVFVANVPLKYIDGDAFSLGSTSVSGDAGATATAELTADNMLRLTVSFPAKPFTVGTDFSCYANVLQNVTRTRDGSPSTGTFTFVCYLAQADNKIAWYNWGFSGAYGPVFDISKGYCSGKEGEIEITSTATILGHPTYIDCDTGEAYKISGGDVMSLNRFIDLGSDLPTLASGANTFTFDNTITELKVIPRWWKI